MADPIGLSKMAADDGKLIVEMAVDAGVKGCHIHSLTCQFDFSVS